MIQIGYLAQVFDWVFSDDPVPCDARFVGCSKRLPPTNPLPSPFPTSEIGSTEMPWEGLLGVWLLEAIGAEVGGAREVVGVVGSNRNGMGGASEADGVVGSSGNSVGGA